MPFVALKASWTVVASVLPGDPEAEFTRSWQYTSADYEEDAAAIQADPEKYGIGANPSIFQKRMKEANDYMLQLTNPARFNWVRLEFIWL